MEEKKPHIKAMLPSEVAELYGVSIATINRWLNKINKNGELNRENTNFYTPAQIKYIFEKLGVPS
jgi:transposase